MRKKTVKCLFDSIFWYALYLLPLIVFVLVSYKTGTFIGLSSAMQSIGLDIITNNPIFTSLNSVFGVDGILPLFTNTAILEFVSYFISVFLIHIAVDFVLFIPRLAMSWLETLYGGGHD